MDETSATPDNTVPHPALQSSDHAELALIRLITRAHIHGIQNSLGAIRFRLLDLREGELEPYLAQELNAVQRDVDSLMEAVEGMNLEVETALEPENVDEVVQRVSSRFAKTVRNFGFDCHCGALGVIVDAPGLPYIVRELLWNFVKFQRPWSHVEASDETQRVSIRTSIANRPGFVSISVSYTGVGIDMTPEFTEQMFERGFSTDAQGSGQGLWLGRALTRQAGGDLRANVSETGGLEFTIELPIISVGS